MKTEELTYNCDVRRVSDEKVIGSANLTQDQFTHYKAMASDGTIRLGALPYDWYELHQQFQGESENTMVYIQD